VRSRDVGDQPVVRGVRGFHGEGAGVAALRGDPLHDVGQVELRLRVVALQPGQARAQAPGPQQVERAVGLRQVLPGGLLGCVGAGVDVALLDDADHAAVGGADDAALAQLPRRLVARGQQGEPRAAVGALRVLRLQAGEDVLRHDAVAHRDEQQRIALPQVGDGERLVGREGRAARRVVRVDVHQVVAQRGHDVVLPVVHQAHDRTAVALPEGVDRVARQRLAADGLDALRLGAETRALAGREDDQDGAVGRRRERGVHAFGVQELVAGEPSGLVQEGWGGHQLCPRGRGLGGGGFDDRDATGQVGNVGGGVVSGPYMTTANPRFMEGLVSAGRPASRSRSAYRVAVYRRGVRRR